MHSALAERFWLLPEPAQKLVLTEPGHAPAEAVLRAETTFGVSPGVGEVSKYGPRFTRFRFWRPVSRNAVTAAAWSGPLCCDCVDAPEASQMPSPPPPPHPPPPLSPRAAALDDHARQNKALANERTGATAADKSLLAPPSKGDAEERC